MTKNVRSTQVESGADRRMFPTELPERVRRWAGPVRPAGAIFSRSGGWVPMDGPTRQRVVHSPIRVANGRRRTRGGRPYGCRRDRLRRWSPTFRATLAQVARSRNLWRDSGRLSAGRGNKRKSVALISCGARPSSAANCGNGPHGQPRPPPPSRGGHENPTRAMRHLLHRLLGGYVAFVKTVGSPDPGSPNPALGNRISRAEVAR